MTLPPTANAAELLLEEVALEGGQPRPRPHGAARAPEAVLEEPREELVRGVGGHDREGEGQRLREVAAPEGL